MNRTEIENELLKYFFDCFEKGLICSIEVLFQNLKNVHQDVFERIADELVEENLLKGLKTDSYAEITLNGFIEMEKRNLISETHNNKIRFEILKTAYKKKDSDEYDKFASYEDFDSIDFSTAELHFNFELLEAQQMIKIVEVDFDGNPQFYIKPAGLLEYEKWQKQLSFVDEFHRLSNLVDSTPQQRGRKLEKLIAQISEFAGWQQEVNVTTTYEEIDVIIHKNREFYLIECKWEKDPSQAKVADKLLGKLGRRIGTNGILMSMSGFTKGCVDCVKDSTNQKLILLFGKEDIEQIISNPNSFEELLNEKHKELIMRRNVIWN